MKGGVSSIMIVVKAQPNEPSDSLIRKFNKKVLSEGILSELKKREFYQKPALVRKEKKAALRKRTVVKMYKKINVN